MGTRDAAERVKREIETRLALGGMGTLEPEKTSLPKFKDYAKAWLENVEHELKPSTAGFYSQYLRLYVLPRFGEMELDAIKRDAAKSFITDLRHRNLAAPHLR